MLEYCSSSCTQCHDSLRSQKSHQSNYWLCQKKNTLSFHRSEEQSWTKSQSLKKKNSTNTTIVGYHSLFFVSSSFQCDPKISILKSGSTVRLVLIASVCTTLLLSNVSRPKLLQSMLFRLLSLKSTHCRKKNQENEWQKISKSRKVENLNKIIVICLKKNVKCRVRKAPSRLPKSLRRSLSSTLFSRLQYNFVRRLLQQQRRFAWASAASEKSRLQHKRGPKKQEYLYHVIVVY